jgi:methylenetetrahydrofolate reductase (NADPH)
VKQKVDAGAEYIVTQMFFENRYYFSFVKECRDQGIDVPIIPGLKIITSAGQLTSIPRNFYCEIPESLAQEIESTPEHVREIGVAWAAEQVRELLESGARSVHFYVLAGSRAVNAVLAELGI